MNSLKLATLGLILALLGSVTSGCVIAYPRRQRVWVPVYHPHPVPRPVILVP